MLLEFVFYQNTDNTKQHLGREKEKRERRRTVSEEQEHTQRKKEYIELSTQSGIRKREG